jgi:hypothetical protein
MVVDRLFKSYEIKPCRLKLLHQAMKLYIPGDVTQTQQMKSAMKPMDYVVQHNSFSPIEHRGGLAFLIPSEKKGCIMSTKPEGIADCHVHVPILCLMWYVIQIAGRIGCV